MADDPLAPLDRWIVQALASVSPEARLKLMREVGRELRRRNQRRIAAETAPDGSKWAPRKRDRHGRIKKKVKMLQGFRDGRRLQLQATAAGLSLGFAGRNAVIGRIHHDGEAGQVVPGGPTVKYPRRQLIGLSQDDREFVYEKITQLLRDAAP